MNDYYQVFWDALKPAERTAYCYPPSTAKDAPVSLLVETRKNISPLAPAKPGYRKLEPEDFLTRETIPAPSQKLRVNPLCRLEWGQTGALTRSRFQLSLPTDPETGELILQCCSCQNHAVMSVLTRLKVEPGKSKKNHNRFFCDDCIPAKKPEHPLGVGDQVLVYYFREPKPERGVIVEYFPHRPMTIRFSRPDGSPLETHFHYEDQSGWWADPAELWGHSNQVIPRQCDPQTLQVKIERIL